MKKKLTLEEQLKVKLTQEVYDKFTKKSYTSGKPLKVGDSIIFVLLLKEVDEKDNRATLEMITIHPSELEDYDILEGYSTSIPTVKKKSE